MAATSDIPTVSQKNCAKLLLSELRQIPTNFDNFWKKKWQRG